MGAYIGTIFGFLAWFTFRYILTSFFIVNQNEIAVKTAFGRAKRLGNFTTLDDPISESLEGEEKERYVWPQVKVIPPGGLYFKWPWERVYKINTAIQTVNMALDLESRTANNNGTILEAVTKDQLNIGLRGQLRFRVSEKNAYAYLFGVKNPVVHVMGYFVSILRERIANFVAPKAGELAGISINDLRKNLSDLNIQMEKECSSSVARYGILLDASLITEIDPPPEVESALAAINTAHNQVSAQVSIAQAEADQKIVQSRRAVEIETLKAQAEIEPLSQLSEQLNELRKAGSIALSAYVRNVRLKLFSQAQKIIIEDK